MQILADFSGTSTYGIFSKRGEKLPVSLYVDTSYASKWGKGIQCLGGG